jgi:transcriptional regulator with XRE-family HTH domain
VTAQQQGPEARGALRSARTARGWSQSRAATELHALATRRGGPDASAASLKTQLSRWENGHALPEPEYRALLSELYDRPAEELGLRPRAPGPQGEPAAALRSELAAARAAGAAVLEQWGVQLTAARRLDDELGAAGAAAVTTALVAQLSRTLLHTVGTGRRPALAALLAGAAALAGHHALDRGDPSAAWERFALAGSAAAEAGSRPALAVAAAAGQAEVLRSIGDVESAADLLAEVDPAGATAPSTALLAAARGVTWAVLGRERAVREAFAQARAAVGRIDVAHPSPDLPVELSDVQRWHGHALLVLHDPGAPRELEGALAAAPRSVRARAALHADLAAAHAAAGRTDVAGQHARQAHRLAERTGVRTTTALGGPAGPSPAPDGAAMATPPTGSPAGGGPP